MSREEAALGLPNQHGLDDEWAREEQARKEGILVHPTQPPPVTQLPASAPTSTPVRTQLPTRGRKKEATCSRGGGEEGKGFRGTSMASARIRAWSLTVVVMKNKARKY